MAPTDTYSGATLQDVWVATLRGDDLLGQKSLGDTRDQQLRFGKLTVSIPPTHQPGKIEWPQGTPDPSTDFTLVNGEFIPGVGEFTRRMEEADQSGESEVMLFVHGYNTTHGEAVYGAAQFSHDLDVPVPTLVFSWPSSAQVRGYIYDRDSVIVARDSLSQLIMATTQRSNRKVFLVAHSMGSYLLMEALRTLSLAGEGRTLARINGIVLMSPDIDVDVFRTQVSTLSHVPEPFLVITSKNDRALRLSAWLTGKRIRLGSLSQAQDLSGLPITVLDFSDLSDGRKLDHKVATNSPAALSLIRRLNEVSAPGDLEFIDGYVAVAANAPTLSGVLTEGVGSLVADPF